MSFVLPWWHIGLLILSAIFFSYFGNKASLKSVQLAPNPGFALMISKSYVVATTLAAVVLFGSELSLKGILAIGVIVFFAFQIGVDGQIQGQKLKVGKWLIYSLGAFFAWAGLALVSTYFIKLGINLPARLFYICLVVSVIIGLEMYKKKASFKLGRKQWLVLLGISLASMGFNGFMQVGYAVSPNPGYINAVNAASIAALAPLSSAIFRDPLPWRKFVGVIGVVFGLLLLFI